jgi:hypothetical protein
MAGLDPAIHQGRAKARLFFNWPSCETNRALMKSRPGSSVQESQWMNPG